jgi:phenylpropionate dioxygenase-like ring-hydroxylating dioxygenase large terminal subunit
MAAYPTEAWYMAAWSDEIGEALLRRRLLGHPILLYRLADGSVTALDDRCPHRFAPLSLGTRSGDEVTCAYHGLTFDGTGACVRNPFGPPPKGASVRRWPVKERDGIVWFWPGDPARADDTPPPDFAILNLDQPAPPITGLMPMAADYQYGTDNLMDLSHIEFVHRGSFAGRGVIFAGKHKVRQEGDFLHSDWWMPDVAAPAHTFGIYPPDLRTDHWLEMRWQAPATMLLEIGATPAGGARQDGVIVHQAHILTPESEGNTHYFWATTRSGGPVTEAGDAMLRGLMGQAFVEEDKPIIEAAYANLDGQDFWAARPVFLGVDAAGTRARRLLQALINRANPEGIEA